MLPSAVSQLLSIYINDQHVVSRTFKLGSTGLCLSKHRTNMSKPAAASKKARAFQPGWLGTYPWLRKIESGMRCDTCLRASASNPFTTAEGCSNYQNSALTRHQDSKTHTDSVKKLQLRSHFATAVQKASSKKFQDSPNVDRYVKQLRTSTLSNTYLHVPDQSEYLPASILVSYICSCVLLLINIFKC